MILNKNIILHLSLIPGIGPELLKYVTKDYAFCLTDELYAFSQRDIMLFFSLSEKKAAMIFSGLRKKDILENELQLLEQHKVQFITPYEEKYPFLLRVNSFFPGVLYFQNKHNTLDFNKDLSLSIVSSRKTNRYGKKVIFDMVEGLASLGNNNLFIVSGGAIGGDTYVHEAAIQAKIKTVAVLGSGLLRWYPKCNEKLFQTIIEEGGTILSHFSLDTSATPTTFPARNALIAGLSQATLVVQAGEKSGTLITANYALEYGRNVGTIPGQIDDPLMLESNNLLKQGAACITTPFDLFQLLGIESVSSLIKNKSNMRNFKDCSELQCEIIALCATPRSLDEIASSLGVGSFVIYEEIAFLLNRKYLKEDILGCFYTV